MVVAPGRGRGADEDRIDEQRRGHLLKPQPGMADGAGDDVGGHRQREAEAEHAAEDHQRELEPVEPAPFEVTLALHQQFVGDGHHYPRRPGESRDPYPQLRVVKASWRLSCPKLRRGVWVPAFAGTTRRQRYAA